MKEQTIKIILNQQSIINTYIPNRNMNLSQKNIRL